MDTSKKYEIIFKVSHASLECKNGVESVQETDKTEDGGFLFNKTRYSKVVDFEGLKEYSYWTLISKFILNEFTAFEDHTAINEEDIQEHLQSVYDDEVVYLYEKKKYTNDGTRYHVYYPMEDKVSDAELDLVKKCCSFTGRVLEKSGLLKSL